MREFKFRAWLHERKKFIYFDINTVWLGYADMSKRDYYESMGNITQYTGLQDKNGKEIYEGDIVTYEKLDQYYFTGKNHVEYSDGGFYPFADKDDGMPYPDPVKCEVIGNIYENPELIKE